MHGRPGHPQKNVWTFTGNAPTAGGTGWVTWQKPASASMVSLFILGPGGNGGGGAIGGFGAAGGGGGGGGGAQISMMIPAYALPDQLFMSIPMTRLATNNFTYVSVYPDVTAAHLIAAAAGGSNGGTPAGGGLGGTAGTGGTGATNTTMPLGWAFVVLTLSGQNGAVGGNGSSSPILSPPTNGSRNMGGTGGGGVPSGASQGVTGGNVLLPADPTVFEAHRGSAGGTSATTPPTNGVNGRRMSGIGTYFYGGTGGGGTYGGANGAGAVGSIGGAGSPGGGGGGGGGCYTGGVAGIGGNGGPGIVILTCW